MVNSPYLKITAFFLAMMSVTTSADPWGSFEYSPALGYAKECKAFLQARPPSGRFTAKIFGRGETERIIVTDGFLSSFRREGVTNLMVSDQGEFDVAMPTADIRNIEGQVQQSVYSGYTPHVQAEIIELVTAVEHDLPSRSIRRIAIWDNQRQKWVGQLRTFHGRMNENYEFIYPATEILKRRGLVGPRGGLELVKRIHSLDSTVSMRPEFIIEIGGYWIDGNLPFREQEQIKHLLWSWIEKVEAPQTEFFIMHVATPAHYRKFMREFQTMEISRFRSGDIEEVIIGGRSKNFVELLRKRHEAR
jgi:hypothetical protein